VHNIIAIIKQVQSNLVRGEIALTGPHISSFLFASWQHQFPVACFVSMI